MTKLMQLLFALVGSMCAATVITLALGLIYLWHTDRLNDEKMFRLVALLHDVDLQQISAAEGKTADVEHDEHDKHGHNGHDDVREVELGVFNLTRYCPHQTLRWPSTSRPLASC